MKFFKRKAISEIDKRTKGAIVDSENITNKEDNTYSANIIDKKMTDIAEESGDSVSFTQSLTSGTKVGALNINGTVTNLYAPTPSTGAITTQVKSYTSGELSAYDVNGGTGSFSATGPGSGWYPTCVTASANTTTVLSTGISLRGSGISMTSAGNNTCSGNIFFTGNGGGTCRGTVTYYVTWAKVQ